MSLNSKGKAAIRKHTGALSVSGVYKNSLSACFATAFLALTATSASVAHAASAPLSLEQAKAVSKELPKLDAGIAAERNLRAKAQQEAAQSYGARSGLLARSNEIREALKKVAPQLDATWNFTPLMLIDKQPGEVAGTMRPRMIVPPVVVQAEGIYKQENAYLVRTVDKTYKLNTLPRFASTAPTWRTYLLRDLGETTVTPPHVSLLPRTDDERSNWDRWIDEGWASGVKQADAYFDYDLNRLYRDWDGMITYHEMVKKNMVSLPYVATANQAISGDDNTMNINDSILRITVLPAFRHDSKTWVPLHQQP